MAAALCAAALAAAAAGCESPGAIADAGPPGPTVVSTSVDDADSSFSVHARAGDVLVCWSQSPGARAAGLYAATLTPTAALARAPTALYRSDPARVGPLLLGTSGDCLPAAAPDDALFIALEYAEVESFSLKIGSRSLAAEDATSIFDQPDMHAHARRHTRSARVGDEAWLLWLTNSGGDPSDGEAFWMARLGTDVTPARIALPTSSLDHRISAAEFTAGTDGAWLSVLARDGEADFAWVDTTSSPAWATDPLPPERYLAGYPLAVRGQQLAVAFRLTGETWQIYWLDPGPLDGTNTRTQSLAAPGPTFTLAPGARRPGAWFDGDTLLLAGPQSPADVTVWSVPWGTAAPPALVGAVTKTTPTTAQRVALARVAGSTVVLWTEHTVLYASPLPAPMP